LPRVIEFGNDAFGCEVLQDLPPDPGQAVAVHQGKDRGLDGCDPGREVQDAAFLALDDLLGVTVLEHRVDHPVDAVTGLDHVGCHVLARHLDNLFADLV